MPEPETPEYLKMMDGVIEPNRHAIFVLDLKLVKWEKTEETVEATHAPVTIS